MLKKHALETSLVIDGLLFGILIWFLSLNPKLSEPWAIFLFFSFRSFGYYIMGFLVLYCIICMIMLFLPNYEFEENTLLKWGFIFVWIIIIAIGIFILSVLAAILQAILLKYIKNPWALIISFVVMVIIIGFPRTIIKNKFGIDFLNISTFFESGKSDKSKPTIKPYF